MGPEARWSRAVITAVAVCLLSASPGAATLVRARLGSSVELGCDLASSEAGTSLNLFPYHVVEWVRLGYNMPILIKFGVYAPRVHPNYQGRVSLTQGASMLVERLTLEDEGWFECRILLLDSKTDDFRNGTWTFLSITAPPVFIKTPPTFMEALVGDSLTLSCGAHGNPRPTVVWHKDDNPIEKHQKIKVLNGTLSLASITRNTSGVYKCHVSNSEGNLSHATQLQVKGPPIIVVSPEDTTLNMTQDALLPCQAEAYPANLTYEWLKQGQNVYHIESLKFRVRILVDGTLLIPNLIPEDAGDYTCIPTNGILTPPSASAHLKVKHPARVGRMPRETYLPTGMQGIIVCPVQADPPMLFVNWTKDGNSLNFDSFPGWMVNSEGSVFIAAANDNAVGKYTCTAYNSYGTLGQSEPTQVILKDPPSFSAAPRPEYLQEVGRQLIIPCEATGDPTPNITWTKIGASPSSPYAVLANGSLLLQPLGKDHHGGWECRASNLVAAVSAGTVVMVLGTSPHMVTSVSVSTEVNQANVSWVPGFDGGYVQSFTVWVKQTAGGKHEWTSLLVPTPQTHLLVPELVAKTNYQFCVLAQNKLGSGPFSEIVSVWTKAVPTIAPPVIPTPSTLDPPVLLSVNRTQHGVLLQWSPPAASQSSPLTGFVLQGRRDRGSWVVINKGVDANASELLIIQGLLRDCKYELRLMSQSRSGLSQPSETVSVSTADMEMYPLPPTLMEMIPEPLLAGVIGGICFLFVAIVLSVMAACFMSHRRRQRRRRKRTHDLPSAFQKNSTPSARSSSRSPDSVLKLKLCPPLPFFPNSSTQSDRSSFDKGSQGEYQDQRRQLLSSSTLPPHYTLFESHLGSQAPSPTALQSISRGPDGRFVVQTLPEGSTPPDERDSKRDVLQSNGGPSSSVSNRTSLRDSPKSSALSSERDSRKDSPLTVDIPDLSRPPFSPGRGVRTIARNLSRHGCFYSDDEQGSEVLLERATFYSDNSEKKPSWRHRTSGQAQDLFPSLSRRAQFADWDRELRDNTTLVSHLDAELGDRDSVSKRAQLAKERAEMERELERYTAGRRRRSDESDQTRSNAPGAEDEPVWKPQDVTLRQKPPTGRVSDHRRACYFGNTSSPMEQLPSSQIQWDLSPVRSVTGLVAAQENLTTPRTQRPLSPDPAEATQVSVPVDSSYSPVTQNTSLPMLSPDGSAHRPYQTPARSKPPDRQASEDDPWLDRSRDGSFTTRSTTPRTNGARPWDTSDKMSPPDQRNLQSPGPSGEAIAPYHQPQRAGHAPDPERTDAGPHGYSTLPYEAGAKAKDGLRLGTDGRRSSGFYPDQERDGVRTRSRRSDKCLFSDSPSPVSSLTLVEEADSDPSEFSVPRMSQSFKTRTTVSPGTSSLQTSAILEYLSLPGFIEMSVDEPVEEEDDVTGAAGKSPASSPGIRPDVVPQNWEVHIQITQQMDPSKAKGVCFGDARPESSSDRGAGQSSRHPPPRVGFPEPPKPFSFPPGKTAKQLYGEKLQTAADRPEWRPGSRPAVAARGAFVDSSESLMDRPQRPASQGSRANAIVSRIPQAPTPFMKKSFSLGPCRTLSAVVPPRPFLKKSISLGSQRWEHFESPRTYVSERCYWDEFPHPDVRVKSYSLGRGPSSFARPGPSWREYAPCRRPSAGSLERSHPAQGALHGPAYLSPSVYPPRMEAYDPRRHAAVFPDSARWSPVYQDTLRSIQHKYVPMHPPVPVSQYVFRPAYRDEAGRPQEPRRGPPRSFLPRGVSWPSPGYAHFPPREPEFHREPERMQMPGRGAEPDYRSEAREGGRASYASQSSGRGSAGLFRQSLSITPTLLSSPETTEESERRRVPPEPPERRAKRRNTSVDESYEWDSADVFVDSEVLEATRSENPAPCFRTGRDELSIQTEGAQARVGLQDQQQKGPPPHVSSPVSIPPRCQQGGSLSEARFNALRLEYQEFRRAQESGGPSPGPESDSDSSSALL